MNHIWANIAYQGLEVVAYLILALVAVVLVGVLILSLRIPWDRWKHGPG